MEPNKQAKTKRSLRTCYDVQVAVLGKVVLMGMSSGDHKLLKVAVTLWDRQSNQARCLSYELSQIQGAVLNCRVVLVGKTGPRPPPHQYGAECALMISRCLERNDLKYCGSHTSPSVNDVRPPIGTKWLFWLRPLDGVLKSHWSGTWCRIEERLQKW